MHAALLTLAATVIAAPVPKGAKEELYFPVTVGAKRVSTIPAAGTGDTVFKLTETVTKVEEKDGVYLVTVDSDRGGVIMPTRVFAVSAKGVFQKSYDGVEAKEPVPFLKAGKAGDTWEVPVSGGTGKQTFTRGDEEEVEVQAGKYRAVRVDSVTTTARGPEPKVTTWFAPGVGVVKCVTTIANQEAVYELKSFTPGKEMKAEPKTDK
jgi:hypothetical protein